MSPGEWVADSIPWITDENRNEKQDGTDRLARVLFTRSVRHRNFNGFPFLISCPPETCAIITSHARSFSGTLGFSNPIVLADQHLNSIGFLRERQWLPENPVTFPGKRNFKLLFLGSSSNEHALFGEVEHWTQIKVRPGLPDAIDHSTILDRVENKNKSENENVFSHSPAYGFLTSNPSFAGPGLQLECGLHLPALNASRRIHAVAQALSALGMQMQPLSLRTPGIAEAGFFRIVTCGGMKFPEEVLYQQFKDRVHSVLAAEEEALEKWSEREKNQLADRLHRSLRLLQEARTLDYTGFLTFASFARLGVYSGLFPANLLPRLEELRIQTQPFHLAASLPENQGEENPEMDSLRSEQVRTSLKPQ